MAAKPDAARILVVDDERVIREILTDFLEMEGYRVSCAADGQEALNQLAVDSVDLVITDLKMPNLGGIELIDQLSKMKEPPVILVMTGYGTVETAVGAMKRGAYDYIGKPFKVEDVVHVVRRGLEKKKLEQENIQLKETVSLYKMSEALNQGLSLDRILEVIVDTTMREVDCDVVSLILKSENSGRYETVVRQVSFDLAKQLDEDLAGELDVPGLMAAFSAGRSMLLHNDATREAFSRLPGGIVSRRDDDGERMTRSGLPTDSGLSGPASKPPTAFVALPLRVGDRSLGALVAYAFEGGRRFSEGKRKLLAVLADRAATAIENARLYDGIMRVFRETLQSLVLALEAKDRYTAGHTKRVTEYTRMVVEALQLPPAQREAFCQGAMLHDIGKIGIDPQKINKPGRLTEEEMAMFRSHPSIGRRILEPIKFLEDIIPSVYYHHEKYDGSGYPEGLRGKDIPLGARIVAVADTYDAMTSTRAYRKALSHAIASAELKRCAGTQFDADIVEAFLSELDRRRDSGAAERARKAAEADEVAPEYVALTQSGAAPAEPAAIETSFAGAETMRAIREGK
jgi:putative nucleotidyltransferase with HDIG domain